MRLLLLASIVLPGLRKDGLEQGGVTVRVTALVGQLGFSGAEGWGWGRERCQPVKCRHAGGDVCVGTSEVSLSLMASKCLCECKCM